MRKDSIDYRSLAPDTFIRRRELINCIAQRHGVHFAKSRFDKFPTEGRGPQFTILGRFALYKIEWVDQWLHAEVKRKLRRPGARTRPAEASAP